MRIKASHKYLLQNGAYGFAGLGTHHVDGRLPLGPGLCIQGDVHHLLRRLVQRELCTFPNNLRCGLTDWSFHQIYSNQVQKIKDFSHATSRIESAARCLWEGTLESGCGS